MSITAKIDKMYWERNRLCDGLWTFSRQLRCLHRILLEQKAKHRPNAGVDSDGGRAAAQASVTAAAKMRAKRWRMRR